MKWSGWLGTRGNHLHWCYQAAGLIFSLSSSLAVSASSRSFLGEKAILLVQKTPKKPCNNSQPIWLVVSTHLKNISQMGSFPQVGMKIKNVWNHHLATHVCSSNIPFTSKDICTAFLASNASESSTSSWVFCWVGRSKRSVRRRTVLKRPAFMSQPKHPYALCYTKPYKTTKSGSSNHQPRQCMPRNNALQQLPVPLLQALSRFCFRDTKRPQCLPAEGSRWIHPRRSANEFQI